MLPSAGEAETLGWLATVWLELSRLPPRQPNIPTSAWSPGCPSLLGLLGLLGLLPGNLLPALATRQPFFRPCNRQSALGKEKPATWVFKAE